MLMYLVILFASFGCAWLILKQRQFSTFIRDCRDQSYLSIFEAETLASERGKVAEDMCAVNPRVANDRDFFVNVCFSSGVKPELAARAWIDRALDAKFR